MLTISNSWFTFTNGSSYVACVCERNVYYVGAYCYATHAHVGLLKLVVMESPEMLIKSFQALQEKRVHTYKLFDEYVHLFYDTVEVGSENWN